MEKSYEKDRTVSFKNPSAGKSKKGDYDVLNLSLNFEVDNQYDTSVDDFLSAIGELIEEARAAAAPGIKLSIYTKEAESRDGRTFLKSFAFLKQKSNGPAGRPDSKPFPKKVMPSASEDDRKAKIEAQKTANLKAKLAGKQLE